MDIRNTELIAIHEHIMYLLISRLLHAICLVLVSAPLSHVPWLLFMHNLKPNSSIILREGFTSHCKPSFFLLSSSLTLRTYHKQGFRKESAYNVGDLG